MRPNQEMYSALKNPGAKKKSIFSTSKKQSIGNRRQTMAATLEANRSNSQLLQDSAMRESHTQLRSSSSNSKGFKLSRGDTLRKGNYQRLLKEVVHRSDLSEIQEIQAVSEDLKRV